jgi:lipoate-protein ligase A
LLRATAEAAEEPALEVALAATLLQGVTDGSRPPALRVYRPAPAVAFGRRDEFLPGFAEAVQAAAAHGFASILRAQGGRAAAYDRDCLVLDEVRPATDSMTGIEERFADAAQRHAEALRALGVDARVGEIPGEYCPGAYTVNAGGARKLIGSAQRIIRGGWLLSTVVVVDGAARLRDVLQDVYDALGLDWDPATVGAVAAEAPGRVTIEAVQDALLAAYAADYQLVEATVSPAELAAATAKVDRYRAG